MSTDGSHQEVTPLADVLSDLSEAELRSKYVEFEKVPEDTIIQFARTNRGVRASKPNRKRIISEFDPERDGADFLEHKANGNLLHNATPPSATILQEKPEHRFLVFLFAQGKSVMQVFTELGGQVDPITRQPLPSTGQWSYAQLCQIRKQTWFQKNLIQYLEECGRDLITATLEAECMSSIDTVKELRDNKKTPPSVRLSAAESLLNRFLGKPTQTVKVETAKTVSDYETEAAAIAREEQQLLTELKHLNPGLI